MSFRHLGTHRKLGHSEGNWKQWRILEVLGNRRAPEGHSGAYGTMELEHLWHSETWALGHLGHLCTQALGHLGYLGTSALGHSSTLATLTLGHSRYFLYQTLEKSSDLNKELC